MLFAFRRGNFMKETRIRSVTKSISWRVIASLATIILVFTFTRNWVISVEVGFLEVVLKIVLYYLHERVWNGMKWGTCNKAP